jgi:hypothetical protein
MGVSTGVSEADRELFQLLIAHPYTINEQLGATNRRINAFCDKYHCSSQIQVIRWDLLGLIPFFLFSRDPIDHPYIIRTWEVIADTKQYLHQALTPNLQMVYKKYSRKDVFPIKAIIPPSNSVQLLYEGAYSPTFAEHWLLTLKEYMVDEAMGDVVHQQIPPPQALITIDADFLKTLETLYNRTEARRFSSARKGKSAAGGRAQKHLEFLQAYEGFLTPYLEIQAPGMVDYVIVLEHLRRAEDTKLFAGGFVGIFPILELYEISDPAALICRFQAPLQVPAKLSTQLLLFLMERCYPSVLPLIGQNRSLCLAKQRQDGKWAPFL